MIAALVVSLTSLVVSIVALAAIRPIAWLWDRCLPDKTASDLSNPSRLLICEQRLDPLEDKLDDLIRLQQQSVTEPPEAYYDVLGDSDGDLSSGRSSSEGNPWRPWT